MKEEKKTGDGSELLPEMMTAVKKDEVIEAYITHGQEIAQDRDQHPIIPCTIVNNIYQNTI